MEHSDHTTHLTQTRLNLLTTTWHLPLWHNLHLTTCNTWKNLRHWAVSARLWNFFLLLLLLFGKISSLSVSLTAFTHWLSLTDSQRPTQPVVNRPQRSECSVIWTDRHNPIAILPWIKSDHKIEGKNFILLCLNSFKTHVKILAVLFSLYYSMKT